MHWGSAWHLNHSTLSPSDPSHVGVTKRRSPACSIISLLQRDTDTEGHNDPHSKPCEDATLMQRLQTRSTAALASWEVVLHLMLPSKLNCFKRHAQQAWNWMETLHAAQTLQVLRSVHSPVNLTQVEVYQTLGGSKAKWNKVLRVNR